MKKNQYIIYQAIFIFFSACFVLTSCQKDFDPNSYKPAQTYGGYSASNQIAPSDLVTHLSFDGSLVDSASGTSATGYGTAFATGIKGQALAIGLNNYALFTPTEAIKNLQSMTISYWINTSENTTGIQTPLSFANSDQFWSNCDMFFDGQTSSSSVFKMHLLGNGGTSEAWLTNWSISNPWGVWQQIVLTYDKTSSTFTFYVNGAVVGTAVQDGFGSPNFASVPSIVIGTVQFETSPSLTTATDAQPWASYVLGSMDELRIYDKALPASDVKALYQLENLGK